MKKYIISTLTAAAAMAVPAFSAELIDSWDFTSMATDTTGSIVGSQGTLTLTTGSKVAYSSTITANHLYITSDTSAEHKTTIDVSNANVTLDEGICIVLTVTTMSGGDGSIYASIETDANGNDGYYAAAIGESSATTTTGSGRGGLFYADGSTGGATTATNLPGITLSYPYTLALTFQGDTMCIYQLSNGVYTLVAQGVMTEAAYKAVNGTIEEIAIGSWDYTSTDKEFSSLGVSKIEIYALPEPSMFGLMFGLGAIGLVATRRRKRA